MDETGNFTKIKKVQLWFMTFAQSDPIMSASSPIGDLSDDDDKKLTKIYK